MSINWNFPNNGGGQIRGISDAGIETFTGTEIQSLAREICQNSLDAFNSSSGLNVYVEFERYEIQTTRIPGYVDYKNKIEKAYNYWSTKSSIKTTSYLKDAIKNFSMKTNYVLRISDYNTTGLLDPYGESDEGWNALIKIDGGATKTGDKAGAFGIGKNAPFCNSDYRLVFYRTLNIQGESAAQGVSRFISFPENLKDSRNTMTTGIGYYGNSNGNTPVKNIESLDDIKKRTEIGTDVFIYGFNAGSTWKSDVICEILDNFLMAIFRNQLSVSVDGSLIVAKNFSKYMQEYQSKLRQSMSYYKVLSSEKTQVFTKDFHSLGTLKLSVLVSPDEKLNKKVLVTRTSGMKLFAIGNISRLISFSGILEMQGKELNEYFREMETPAHDKWIPARYTKNPIQAKQYHDELKEWIRSTILSLGEYSSDEEMEVEGLGGVLQKESLSASEDSDDKKENLHDTISNVIIEQRSTNQLSPKGLFYGSEGEGKSNDSNMTGKVNGVGFSTTRITTGTRKRNKKTSHKGIPTLDGKDSVHIKHGGNINQPLNNVRIMKISMGRYRVSFIAPKDIINGYIEIVTIGENGKSNRLTINEAKAIKNCNNISATGFGIEFSNMNSSQKVAIEFSLVDTRDYAMEVNVYEYN